MNARTTFTPLRGHSMAGQTACPESILPSKPAAAQRHSCHELGICQARLQICHDCPAKPDSASIFFAPGVIEWLPHRRNAIRRLALLLVMLGLGIFAIGLVLGMLRGWALI